jgi:hypothetical protein
MKKLILIGLGIGVLNLAHANTIGAPVTLTSPISGSDALNGNLAYEWGISIPLSAGQTIASATLSFNYIKLTVSGSGNDIHASLINRNDLGVNGVTTFTDNDNTGDYFSTFTGYTALGTKAFSYVGQTQSWSYVFTPAELTKLNTYALDGKFDIGIDPDCHYNVGSITFTYTVSTPVSVPDTATTAGLLGMSFLGLLAFRRKLALN